MDTLLFSDVNRLISEYACLSPLYGPLAYLTRLFQGGKSSCVEYISSSHGSHASPTSERDVQSYCIVEVIEESLLLCTCQ